MHSNLGDNDFPQFRESDFRNLVHSISDIKRVRSCKDALTGDLVLRFDIDYSIFSIGPILKILSEFRGLSASFYLLVDSNQYNIFSKLSRSFLEKIAEHGHEIGLHFNPTVGEQRQDILQADFDRQMELLEMSLGWRATSYSVHNPSSNGFFSAAGDVINLYGEKYFSKDRYVSDSSHRDPTRILAIVEQHDDAICQLLLHPENFLGLHLTYAENVYEHFNATYRQFLSDFKVNTVLANELSGTKSIRDFVDLTDH